VGAAGVGAEATTVFGHGALGIASAIITLLILFLSEIIPKTLGAIYAKPLAPFTAAATRSMMLVTYPLVICLTWLNRLLGRGRSDTKISRAEVRAAVQLGRRSGSLNRKEYRILANLLSLGTIKLHRILTPRTVVFALPAEYSVGRVFAEHATLGFTRIPVFGASRDEIKGYVTRFQLEEAHRAGRDSVLLSELVRPVQTLPEQATAADAMDMMLREHDHIAIVIDEHGGLEGIVTLEDLLETLLGTEIVDETDKEVDLQEVARRIASRRGAGRSRRE
jgi:CBS domain containing-hemolysin-like protein